LTPVAKHAPYCYQDASTHWGNTLVNGMGNIALQRVKGNHAMGSGAMNGIT
jgi:hypothetical protein